MLPLVLGPANRLQRHLASWVARARWRFVRDPAAFPLAHRNDFPHLLNHLGLLGEGAEIGTWVGRYAHRILGAWKGRRLHCVDPWIHFESAAGYIDLCNQDQGQMDRWFDEARTRLAPFGNRCVMHRTTSAEAAGRFTPGQLDFVYIDAQHQYEAVRADLGLWGDKVRPGGYLAGHDFLDGQRPQGLYGVRRAVEEWAAARGKRIVVSAEADFPSWFIRV